MFSILFRAFRGGRGVLACFCLAIVAPAAFPQEPFAGVDDKWRHYQSPNFELYSRTSDDESRQLLHDLELLRGHFLEATNLIERRPVEVTVYAFSSKRDFDAYKMAELASSKIAGLYLSRPDRAVIMVAPANDRDEARWLIFHEYIHHLIRVSGLNPPLWLNEGLAELFSTVEVKSGSLVFGRPRTGHVGLLQISEMMPLNVLLGMNQARVFGSGTHHTGVFYAQAWALLHYWYFGDAELPRDRIDILIRFLLANRRPL